MWIGACTSTVGTWMQTVAQSWLVYTLSKDNPFYLGLDGFLGQIPIMLFSLIGGVIADRSDRRTVLLGSQYVQMSCAFLLATPAYFHVVQVWHILCLSFTVGMAQSFGGPAYSALIPSLVPKDDLPNAIALAKLGADWCFGLNGISFVAVIVTLYVIKVGFIPAKSSGAVLASMKEGIAFIRVQEGMKPLIVLSFLMTR